MASNKLRTRIVYTSEAVDQMSDAEVRKAYTSIRHIAVERAKRLSKYGYTNTAAAKEAARLRDFPTLASMTSEGEVRQMLLDTSRWLRNRFSKATEVKKSNKQKLKAFRDMGYEFLNEGNIVDFLNFLSEAQETYADKNYDYAKIADAYEIAQKYQIPANELLRDFDSWMSGETMKKIQKLGEGASADDVRKIISKKAAVKSAVRQRIADKKPFKAKEIRRDVKRKRRR